ncbi:MAG: hypothetical protein K9H61_06070 [Bacteroidia bacterium]|nr:hypothetical protein [Bacteroidia bacterium]MCF8446545.1 hypothetical protein [Bacteroidia bacterium]
MRPQDIVILLKIVAKGESQWQLLNLANELKISNSEISESLNRSKTANLLDFNKKLVKRQNFMEFIEHGLKYVFPQEPGTMVRGTATAHSHPFMAAKFNSATNYVWPDENGTIMGLAIEPYYKKQTEAVKEDGKLFKLLALTDVIRVGKTREIKTAIEELKKIIL